MNIKNINIENMNIENCRNYCLSKKGVTDSFPFDERALVFKVLDKMFLLAVIDSQPLRINAKCDPERAIELREKYESIIPGYHMNKKHWNTIEASSEVSDELFIELIDHSYELVVSKLTKKQKMELNSL